MLMKWGMGKNNNRWRWVALVTGSLVLSGSAVFSQTTPGATNAPAPPSAPAPAPKDTLEFLNGDLLRGTFLSYDNQSGVRWQHGSIKHVLSVNPSGLYKVRIPQTKGGKTGKATCVVRLANGDDVYGDLARLDEQSATINTWFAGPLVLAREQLRSLRVGLSRFDVVYEGPTGLDGWTVKGGQGGNVVWGGGLGVFGGNVVVQGAGRPGATGWQFRDDAFYGAGNGSIGRDFKLPPASNIEFDLAWQGYPQISLFFYTDHLEGYGGNAYVMQFSYRNIYLRRQSQSGRSSNLGNIEMPNLAGRNKSRISIRTDRENNTVALFMDETLVKQWVDNAGNETLGGGILFFLQGQQAVKISNIRITDWDGRLDDTPDTVSSAKQDLVKLANKDKVSGTVTSIRDGKLTFATGFATLEIPLERVNEIEFAADKVKTVPQPASAVRAFFADRGRLTMEIERWNDLQVVGVNPAFGRASFLPSAFAAIQFNLDKQKLDTDALSAPAGVQAQIMIDE